MKRRHRHTIMDGRVVSFAIGFQKTLETPLGDLYDATGPFEVSASRNCVMVHRAELNGHPQVLQLVAALGLATAEHEMLARCDGRPDDGDAGEPRDVQQVCRICGCTNDDCRQCIEKTGHPCYWVEPDLCSACKGKA